MIGMSLPARADTRRYESLRRRVQPARRFFIAGIHVFVSAAVIPGISLLTTVKRLTFGGTHKGYDVGVVKSDGGS